MNFLKYIIEINTSVWIIINIVSLVITVGVFPIIRRKIKRKYIRIIMYILILIILFVSSSISGKYVEVPNVIGLNAENAKQTILENNLLFEFGNESDNTNKIGKQTPESGTYLRKGETVTLYFEIVETIDSNTQNNLKQKSKAEPLKEFPFYTEYNVIYPEAKEIKVPTPEEPRTFSVEIPLDLRGEDYQSDKVPINTDIHGFVVNDIYYCSDDDSVTDISTYNYYKFADYWFYLHTVDISFMDFDGFDLMFNGATIVLQEKETQKRVVLQEDYLKGDFVKFKCSTGQYIIEIQKEGIAYTHNINISKNEKTFLVISPDEYYYISSNDKDSYISLENKDEEGKYDNKKTVPQAEDTAIPESVLSTIYDDDVQELIDNGMYMDAIGLYASKNPSPTPENWCNVGDIFNYYIEDYNQAVFCYIACLEDDPDYYKASEGLKYASEHGGSLDNFEWPDN